MRAIELRIPRHPSKLPSLGDVLQMMRLPQPLQHSLAQVQQPQGQGQHHRSSSSAAVPCNTSRSIQAHSTTKALNSSGLMQSVVAASWKPASTPTTDCGRCRMVTMPTCTAWGRLLMRRMSEQCRQDCPTCKSCQLGWEMAPWCSLPVSSPAAHAIVAPSYRNSAENEASCTCRSRQRRCSHLPSTSYFMHLWLGQAANVRACH